MAIRWRLTLWFSLTLLFILLLSNIVLNVLLQNYLINSIDNNLKAFTSQVHGTVKAQSVAGQPNYDVIHSTLPPINQFSSPGTYIQIIDASGMVVVKSDNLGSQELPINPALVGKAISGEEEIQTLQAGNDTEVRLMVSPMYVTDQTLVLEVAQSLQPETDALSQFRLALVGGTLVALLLTAALGAIIIQRTLKPVDRITRTARQIEESPDLSRRVAYRGPHDEIGQLANTFDLMIGRLEDVFKSQTHFIADASHELRTPLTVIQGNLDLLKRPLSEADRNESLRAIESESKRMALIANDLLLLAQVEAGQINRSDDVSLKALVDEEFRRSQVRAGKRQIVEAEVEDLTVRGDGYKISQLLANLVDNAIKYTPEGGTITLSLRTDNGSARLDVADTGIGIAVENLSHLFDRFFRVDKVRSRAHAGTGLGLAIVKAIAEKHGGRVAVTSQPGKGSTFSVWLKL
jgi:two-component system OmpR family sensor kinase